MAERGEGAASPNQRQGTEPATKSAATTEPRPSRPPTATFTYKLVEF